MDLLTIVIALVVGVLLFLAMLLLASIVERTSTDESAGRLASGSGRGTPPQH
jgi:hypothetical protein